MHVATTSIDHNLLTSISVLEKILRTVIVYFSLVLLLRFVGRRTLAQLNAFDLVVLLLLSNVVQNAVIGSDNSLSGGLIGAVTLVVTNEVVVMASHKVSWLDNLLEGRGRTIIRNGVRDHARMEHSGLTDLEVDLQREAAGADRDDDVERMVLLPWGRFETLLEAPARSATKGDVEHLEHKLSRILTLLERPPR